MRSNVTRDVLCGMLVGLAVIAAGSVAGIYLTKVSCRAHAEAMGLPWTWGFFQDCMVVVDGKSIPLSAYKVVRVGP